MDEASPRRFRQRWFGGREYGGRAGPCTRGYFGREDRVLAEPARQHVERLLAGGMSRAAIARPAGVGRTAVLRLLDADMTETSSATAAAVLAVGA